METREELLHRFFCDPGYRNLVRYFFLGEISPTAAHHDQLCASGAGSTAVTGPAGWLMSCAVPGITFRRLLQDE